MTGQFSLLQQAAGRLPQPSTRILPHIFAAGTRRRLGDVLTRLHAPRARMPAHLPGDFSLVLPRTLQLALHAHTAHARLCAPRAYAHAHTAHSPLHTRAAHTLYPARTFYLWVEHFEPFCPLTPYARSLLYTYTFALFEHVLRAGRHPIWIFIRHSPFSDYPLFYVSQTSLLTCIIISCRHIPLLSPIQILLPSSLRAYYCSYPIGRFGRTGGTGFGLDEEEKEKKAWRRKGRTADGSAFEEKRCWWFGREKATSWCSVFDVRGYGYLLAPSYYARNTRTSTPALSFCPFLSILAMVRM